MAKTKIERIRERFLIVVPEASNMSNEEMLEMLENTLWLAKTEFRIAWEDLMEAIAQTKVYKFILRIITVSEGGTK